MPPESQTPTSPAATGGAEHEVSARTSEEHWVRDNQVKPRAASIVRALRDLADRVEQKAADYDRVGAPAVTSYASVAARIQHDVIWGVANASIDALVGDAIMADDARINGR